MDWKRLFDIHILERGYDYFCENAVENLKVSKDRIRADVAGTDDYEVEISLDNGKITDMYCSCPYADGGRNCKHMAAVLYEWSEAPEQDDAPEAASDPDIEKDLFRKARTAEALQKREDAIRKLVESTDIAKVKAYLVSVLSEDEKRLTRFYSIVSKQAAQVNVKQYIRQVDQITKRYLGRDNFIDYREARGYISELREILEEDVCGMMDHKQYESAFEIMNYIFVSVGDVAMDDSDGGTGMLAAEVYDLWLELLEHVEKEEKRKMFQWFLAHLGGSIMDYLEEFIERVIMEEFQEEEYFQEKLLFVEKMIKKSEQLGSDWSRSYNTGKWAERYLGMLEARKRGEEEIEEFCAAHWENSAVRRYYIDRCVNAEKYDQALQALDESILLDKSYAGLVIGYQEKKKSIYLLKGDREAYQKQLWKLMLEDKAGDINIFRELKGQYAREEWPEKREEIFAGLPKHARFAELYVEEKLYGRLLELVLESPGIYTLQKYADYLKKDYPEQILQKYEKEVIQIAAYAADRSKYRELVRILRDMRKLDGGKKAVEEIAQKWRLQYKRRPAMMDELKKL